MSSPIARRTVLGLMGAAALSIPHATAAVASGPAPAVAGPDVTLVDNGSSVTLSNGLIQFTVVKSTARITDLRLLAGPQADSSTNLFAGAHGNGYTEFNYSGAPKAVALTGAVFSVVSQTSDRVEISMLADDPSSLGFYVDIRMAIERGRPGIYNYWIVKYPEDMPDGLTLTQLRYAYAADTPAFRWFVVDDERGVQQRPTAAELKEAVTLQDSTVVLPDGTLYSKYQNKSNLEGDNHVFMISDGKVGLSLVQASKESFGSPTRQELTCHDYYDGMILLWHPIASHYTANVEVSRGWAKVYGPSYLHVSGTAVGDERANVEALWKDAKRAAAREQAEWPYKWITDATYAATERSTVSGKLSIASLGTVANGWAVLYQPEPDRQYQEITLDGNDWQYAGRGYVYAAKIAPNGRFAIPAVRPGTYTLAAFAKGAMGEYRHSGIKVPAAATVNVGNHVWKPTSHGKTLWQIGNPDRTSQDFHIHGGDNGYYKSLTWLEYPYEFPNGVDFKVGVDDPATDWNYFHPAVRTPGTPAQLQWRGTNPDSTLEAWKIRFDARRYRRGTGYLDISLAASVFSTLAVTLNGEEIASFAPVPGVRGDGSSYRLAARAAHRQLPTITFPAGLIRAGENVLTLTPVSPAEAPTADNWMQPMSGVMYDAIRLQVDRT
ncbi:polysaccharide lyase family protein [Streptomyces sp. NBC_00464]|uniref:polysaccharide lyase family protein n=1 Tax=Streptomyces sp. NBC_00464 TaxID=2975751 RepID=UPI002E1718A0